MKFILGLTMAFMASSAMAQAPSIQITSFNFTGTHTTVAELCGKVTNFIGNEVVQINVDPNSKAPAHYMTLISDDGSFCIMISTMTGEATAAIKGVPANSGQWRAAIR